MSSEGGETALGPDAAWSRRVRRFRSGLLGGLAAAAPSVAFVGEGRAGTLELVGLSLAALVLAGTAVHQGRGGGSRGGVVLGTVLALVAVGPDLLSSPGWSFALGALVLVLLSWRRRPSRKGGLDSASPDVLPVWGALGPAGVLALVAALTTEPPLPFAISAGASGSLAALLGANALRTLDLEPRGRRRWASAWVAVVLLGAFAPDLGLRCGSLVLAGALPLFADRGVTGETPFTGVSERVLGQPELLVAIGFGAAVVVGTVLLALPASSAGASPVHLIDAFFTAVSATCVTGLIVLDTPTAFSGVGQLTILALIQLGGLGIMTFSTAALFVLNRRPSVRHERALGDVFVSWRGYDPAGAVRRILAVTFLVEGLGALLLAARFATAHGDGIGQACWRGLFTAVSAFCNAGFALQTNSLVLYQGDPVVTLLTSAIIVLGGLGPVVVVALRERGDQKRLIEIRLVLLSSACLVLGGAAVFGAFEWSSALGELPWTDRLHNALFQSVTTRTAGFNSVDFTALRAETQVLIIGLMFIGGAPGSTAGGIKVTTFAVILMSVAAAVRGRPEAIYRHRRISHDTFYRATAIFVLGLAAVTALWGALLLTQPLAPLEALFESVSALGTAGLSVGATPRLDEVGKLLVAAAMFVGRLGPVTVLFLFAAERRPPKWDHPEMELPVG